MLSSRLFTIIFAFLAFSPVAFADTVLDIEESGLRVKLDADAADNWYTLTLTPRNRKSVTPEVFALVNPPRLVIDVPGFPVQAARQAPVTSGRVAGLRIGVHPDKLRLVFDLKEIEIPSFATGGEAAGESALVTFNFGGAARQPVVPMQETPPDLRPPQSAPEVVGKPTIIRPPQTIVTSSSSAMPGAVASGEEFSDALDTPLSPQQVAVLNKSEDLAPIHAPAVEPVEVIPPASGASLESANSGEMNKTDSEIVNPAATPGAEESAVGTSAPAVITGRATVKGIFFKSTAEYGPSLVVSIDSLGKYSLVKKQENLFELVLENAQFAGSYLELPQFSPDTFDGLDVLIAEKRGADVALKIYTGEGIRLAPFRIKGELWIRIVK